MSAFARVPGPSVWKAVPQTKTAAPSTVKAAAPGDAQCPDPTGISPLRRTSRKRPPDQGPEPVPQGSALAIRELVEHALAARRQQPAGGVTGSASSASRAAGPPT